MKMAVPGSMPCSCPQRANVALIAHITLVEVASALARRRREGTIVVDDYAVATKALLEHARIDYDLVVIDDDVVNRACQLLDRHPLRAYDAVQLASALVANQALLSAGLTSLVFASADDRLNKIALAEGLVTDNPNLHD
jgi:predicted nucleic acid-binding protein